MYGPLRQNTNTHTLSKRKMEITRERSWKVAISMIQPDIMIQRFVWWPHSNLGKDYRWPRGMTPATEAASLKLWYLSQCSSCTSQARAQSPCSGQKKEEVCSGKLAGSSENTSAPRSSGVYCGRANRWQMRRDGWTDKHNDTGCDRKLLTSAGHGKHGKRRIRWRDSMSTSLFGEPHGLMVERVWQIGLWEMLLSSLKYWDGDKRREVTTSQLFAHLLQFICMPRPKRVLQNINISVCSKVGMGRWKISWIAIEKSLRKWIVVNLHRWDSCVRR